MKKAILILFLLTATLWVQAKKIETTQARNVGIAYFYEHAAQFKPLLLKSLDVSSTLVEYEGSTPLYYIFNLGSEGFVIVSADDRATPVLGYSYESVYDPSNLPDGFKFWMNEVRKTIATAISDDIKASPEIESAWAYYSTRTPDNMEIKKSKAVSPLMTSTWNQDKYYNQLCPVASGGPDGRAYAGCVATSMGQIMYYYRFPNTGQGTHSGINLGNTTYQWDNMLDDLGNYNDAVATLLYHAGKTVNMNYSATGSGAQTSDVPEALENHFRYSSDCNYASYTWGGYSQTSWKNLLKGNLDAKHPLIYSGTDDANGGHAWNCDGYDASDNFHMNWGWSGAANGYYAINNLTAGGYSFTSWHGVVYNAYPPTTSYPANCTGTKNITFFTGTIEDGSGPSNYQNNNDCRWLIDPTETVSKITLTFISFATEASNDVVTIYNGSTTSDPVIGTYSGSTLPASVTSTGPTMLVRFQTNGSTTNAGWKAMYRSTFPSYCSGITTLSTPSGNIEDGSGSDNYTYNHLCRWSIAPPNASSITLSFSAFNVASNDFLKIYDQVTNTEMANYSGATIPASHTYNTSKLMLLFKSDGYQNAPGFSASYTSTTTGIDQADGYDALRVYPNPAGKQITIEFNPGPDSDLSVSLYSLTGKLILSEEISNISGLVVKNLDISSCSSGTYLLRISGASATVSKLIVVE